MEAPARCFNRRLLQQYLPIFGREQMQQHRDYSIASSVRASSVGTSSSHG
jgi:hypothetical protein